MGCAGRRESAKERVLAGEEGGRRQALLWPKLPEDGAKAVGSGVRDLAGNRQGFLLALDSPAGVAQAVAGEAQPAQSRGLEPAVPLRPADRQRSLEAGGGLSWLPQLEVGSANLVSSAISHNGRLARQADHGRAAVSSRFGLCPRMGVRLVCFRLPGPDQRDPPLRHVASLASYPVRPLSFSVASGSRARCARCRG